MATSHSPLVHAFLTDHQQFMRLLREVSLALGICDEMALRFDGDELGFKTQTVERLSKTVTATEGWSALGESAIRIAEGALEADRYEEAERLVEAAKAAPSKVRSGELRARFEAHGQGHVFRFWDRLGDDERHALLQQAAGIDLPGVLAALAASRRAA